MKKKVCLIPVDEPSPAKDPSPAERAVAVAVQLKDNLDTMTALFGPDSGSAKMARAEWYGAFRVIHAAGLDPAYIGALVAAKH